MSKISKKSVVLATYATVHNQAAFDGKIPSRKTLIEELMNAASISSACASTYLSNIKTGKWPLPAEENPSVEELAEPTEVVELAETEQLTVEVGKLTIDEVNAMSTKQLVDCFNKRVNELPEGDHRLVKKFSTRGDGIKRVLALYDLV